MMETSSTSGASVFPSTTYKKPYLTHNQMIDQLQERGMIIEDRLQARAMLQNVGYYRLSGYWYSWRERMDPESNIEHRSDNFVPKSKFSDVVALYDFDSALRSILLEGISALEVKLRATLAHVVGEHDHFFYLKRDSYSSFADKTPSTSHETNFERLVRRSDELIGRSSEVFVEHFRAKYDGMPPIWIAVETWDLGMLSTCTEMLKSTWRKEVAAEFEMPIHKALGSSFKSLNHVRNICAHQGRLYRRVIKPQPPTSHWQGIADLAHITDIHETQRRNKLYPTLAWMIFTLQDHPEFQRWFNRLTMLLASFPTSPHAKLFDFGFPDEWEKQEIWSRFL